MAKTVEKSLNSILNQIDERFEVVIVDGGSADGSLKILKKLERKHDNLRIVKLSVENSLGKDRQLSIEKARGKYVLTQLDLDDYYYRSVILDFIKIYHAVEREITPDIYLSGNGINVVRKDVLIERGGYRDLPPGAEDKDLWRRLVLKGNLLGLKSAPLYKEIGYKKNLADSIVRIFNRIWGELKSGVTTKSYLFWILNKLVTKRKLPYLFYLFVFPLAYLRASSEKKMKMPEKASKKTFLEDSLERETFTLKELGERYGISIEELDLSEIGEKLFINSPIATK